MTDVLKQTYKLMLKHPLGNICYITDNEEIVKYFVKTTADQYRCAVENHIILIVRTYSSQLGQPVGKDSGNGGQHGGYSWQCCIILPPRKYPTR